MSAQPADHDLRWYNNADRPCKDRPEWGELKYTSGLGQALKREAMIAACLSCPVLAECREDLQAQRDLGWIHYGIQAGIQGAT